LAGINLNWRLSILQDVLPIGVRAIRSNDKALVR
jgi:hypothetical protein